MKNRADLVESREVINPTPLIIGIGNRYRGDDALGCLMVDELKSMALAGAKIIEHDGEPAALIDCWQDRDCVIMIDAVASGAEAGTLYRIDLQTQVLPESFRSYSTHAFGIAEAVELARVLHKLPSKILFYGLEGQSFTADTQLSSTLKNATKELQKRIVADLI